MTTVATILNAILSTANTKAAAADAASQRAMALARKLVGRRLGLEVDTDDFPNEIGVDRTVPSLNAAEGLKQNMVRDVTGRLNTIFVDFFTTYMPLGSSFDVADDWATRVLQGGGSGLDSLLEEQIFARDRERLLRDKWRQESEVRAQWAARRYPMPPGAMDFQLMQLSRDMSSRIADSSRERALATFQAEIENMRVAMGRAIEMRTSAIDRALAMFRSRLEVEQMSVQYQQQYEQQRTGLINALTTLYSTETNSWRSQRDVERGNIDLKQTDEARVYDAEKTSLELEVQAAIQAATQAGTQAAAALNALHAQGSVSYSESKDRTGE